MWNLLAQVEPEAVELLNEIPYGGEDLEWWVIALVIASGAALFTFGMGRVARFAFKKHGKEGLYELVTRCVLIAFCAGLGAVAGWRLWDTWLGGVAGIVGSGAAPILVTWITGFAGKFLPQGSDKKSVTDTQV